MKKDKLEGLMKVLQHFGESIDELVQEVESTKKPAGRVYSVSACVTVAEKEEIDEVCAKISEDQGWRISRGALLRLVWLYFLDNYENIDLSKYRD